MLPINIFEGNLINIHHVACLLCRILQLPQKFLLTKKTRKSSSALDRTAR
jgi:hypothetical protein